MITIRQLQVTATTICCAALLTSCASLGTSTPTANGSNQSSTPAETAAAATGAQALQNWYANGGQANVDAIGATMDKIGADSSDITALTADCQQLISDVTAAQAADPIPDKQAQLSWSTGLDHLHQGASDCTAGAQAQDASQVSKGATEISEGTTDLTAVTTRINEINRQ